jgi:deoxyribonuclease V
MAPLAIYACGKPRIIRKHEQLHNVRKYANIRVQNEMAKKVISENTLKKEIIYICGVDLAYRNNIAYCSAVLMNKNSMEVKESVNITLNVKYPYVPSFFYVKRIRSNNKYFETVKKPF